MSNNLRISPTLLDSFAYYQSIDSDELMSVKRQEIIDYLNGIKSEPNEAMTKGIQFEADVVAAMTGAFVPTGNDAYDSCVQEVFEEVNGSLTQVHLQGEIDGIQVHGFSDFLRFNRIIDTKYCKKYDIGKYQKKNQHLIYLYCCRDTNIDHFTYLATDLRNVYREDYTWQPSYEDTLRSNIRVFLDYLECDPEMRDAFENKMKKASV